MSTCFPSFPLLHSYILCSATTLKIILLVSFWLQNTIFAFRNASSEQTAIPSNCFSLHEDQPHLPICISFSIMCIHVYLLSATQALSFIAYTASGIIVMKVLHNFHPYVVIDKPQYKLPHQAEGENRPVKGVISKRNYALISLELQTSFSLY